MCKCNGVEFGSYDNIVTVTAPPQIKNKKAICLDACIAREVQHLWSLGIVTTGSCCGHNKTPDVSFIGVIYDDIEAMKNMGYTVRHNPSRPGDQDSFIPKRLDKAV